MQLGAGDVQIPLSKCSIIIVHYSKMQVGHTFMYYLGILFCERTFHGKVENYFLLKLLLCG